MATTQYVTGNDRAAQEAQELAAAEAEFNGTTVDPEAQAQDTQPEVSQDTPQASDVDWEKRYKDLQSHHDRTTQELKGQLKELGGEPDEADRVAELERQLADLAADKEARETDDIVAQAQATVGSVHPDFVSVINTKEFSEWIQGQPKVYQDAIYADRPDAQLSVDALTLFKVQSGYLDAQTQAARQAQTEQAAMNINGGHREAPASQTEKTWSWAEIQALSPYEYDKLEAEIDAAIQSGRVR